MDLSNLVTWAHTHGTICNQIPVLEVMHNVGHPSKDKSVLWICRAGHAYHWQHGKLYTRSREENEAVERRRRSMSSEASSREANLDANRSRIRMALAFGDAQADTVRTGSCSRSPSVTRQRGCTVCMIHNDPSPQEKQNSKRMQPCSAAEQHLLVAGGEVRTDSHKVKLESNKDIEMISDEEQCTSARAEQGDRAHRNVLSESLVRGAAAEGDLQMPRSQKTAFNGPTVTQTFGSVPPGKPPLPAACVPKSPASSQESLDCGFPRFGPLDPAGPAAETCTARNSSGSATPKERLKSFPVSKAEAKAQLESPTSVTFFAFEATVDVQQQFQLSPTGHGTPGMGFSGDITEHPAEEGQPPGPGHTSHMSASPSPESHNTDPLPAPSKKSVLKKKSSSERNIKIFKQWLNLHCPSETREIHQLPPKDLDSYLALFYTSAKRQKGMDFSARTLQFIQSSIERYLQDHSYQYSVVKGAEFQASQEALKQQHQHLAWKEREAEWSTLENLTDEDVETLRKRGLLNKMHPQGLLYLMFTNIIRGFGASTHSGSHNLYWGQLVLKRSEGEPEYLEWKAGQSAGVDPEQPGPRIFAKPDDPDRCLVAHYKEYAKRRPLDMLHSHDPLYLAPKPLCSVWDQVWYCRKSLTKAKREKMLKAIIQQVRGSASRAKK
ncbi:uncharacterized protein O3Q21_011451 isoform 2-T4 [Podargus strigoides]